MIKTYLFFVLAFIVSCQPASKNTTEINQWEEQASRITIFRDDYGIPHIYGKSDADAIFGMIYAQCEDDFNRVEMNYITAIGRLAEVEGEEKLYNDLRARLYMTMDEAKTMYEEAPAWLKALCDAWADGINYYLHTHPEVKPRLLTEFEPWMPMYFSEGSIGGDIERISTDALKAFYEERGRSVAALQEDFFAEPTGSNGFAIAPELTKNGNAMLLINPHTSFFFRGELHMVSEEGLNAYGAVTWGQFFVYQGFNDKTGWMHTSTYVDVIDEFEETVIEEDGKYYYQYGDERRAIDVGEVVLSYATEDGVEKRVFPTYRTHHGPIVKATGDKWIATKIMWKPVEALTQSYLRTKTTGLASMKEVMDIRTNSSNNMVYADAEGNIGYYHGNFVPKRDTTYNYSEPVDGSNPATDWQGLHPVEECLTIFNPENGWIQNCNSTPFTAAAEYSPKPEDYPNYMVPDKENFRGVQAVRVLTNQQDFTLDKLIDVAYDPRLKAFEVLIPSLVDAYDQVGGGDAAMEVAIKALRNWDYTVRLESVPMSIAVFYGLQFLQDGEAPSGMSRMERLMYYANETKPTLRVDMLSRALGRMNSDFGTWKIPWGEINRYQRLNGDIRQPFNDDKPSIGVPMASSRWGALASFGARRYPDTKKFYGTSGNSFVAVVEFGDKVVAKSLLAGGQSGDPESPHFDDQVDLYVDGEFKDVAFYKEDVEQGVIKQYNPGQ